MWKLSRIASATLLLIGSTSAQKFSCPTTSAGCDSYQELVNAGDKTVADTTVRYVCFRDYTDEFFVIKTSDPLLFPWAWYKWNSQLKDYILDSNAKAEFNWFQIQTFRNGVADDVQMPNVFITGTWRLILGELRFNGSARRTVKTKQAINDVDNLSVDDAQIYFAKDYVSASDKKVTYSLAVQRSTKRFTERFNVHGDPKAGMEESGRCTEVAALPKLPDPPPLTELQQAEKDKMEYCREAPPSDRGYCQSSIVYADDYAAQQKKQPSGNRVSAQKSDKPRQ